MLIGAGIPLGAAAQTGESVSADTVFAPSSPVLLEDLSKAAGLRRAYCYRQSPLLQPPPEGYEQSYIFYFGRHGSTPNKDHKATETLISRLKTAYENGLLTPKGCQLYEDLVLVGEASRGTGGYLSQTGCRQMEGIARRMYVNFTDSFGNYSEIRCVSNPDAASLLSLAAFTNQLASCNPRLRVRLSCDEAHASYVQASKPDSAALKSAKDTLDKNMAYPASDSIFREFFMDSGRAEEIFGSAQEFSRALMQEASQCPNLDPAKPVDLFNYLPFSDICYWWSRENNLVHYSTQSLRASGILRHMISCADRALEASGSSADVCISDADAFLALLAGLNVEGAGEADLCPMAANVQMVFYRNRSGKALVRILLNEREASLQELEPQQGHYYIWDEVKNQINNKLKQK